MSLGRISHARSMHVVQPRLPRASFGSRKKQILLALHNEWSWDSQQVVSSFCTTPNNSPPRSSYHHSPPTTTPPPARITTHPISPPPPHPRPCSTTCLARYPRTGTLRSPSTNTAPSPRALCDVTPRTPGSGYRHDSVPGAARRVLYMGRGGL